MDQGEGGSAPSGGNPCEECRRIKYCMVHGNIRPGFGYRSFFPRKIMITE